MKQPAVFREFALYCLEVEEEDGYDDYLAARSEIVRKAYQRLPVEQQREILDYLNALLADGAYTNDELRDIWWGSGAGFIFFSGARGFLKDVRDMIANDLA